MKKTMRNRKEEIYGCPEDVTEDKTRYGSLNQSDKNGYESFNQATTTAKNALEELLTEHKQVKNEMCAVVRERDRLFEEVNDLCLKYHLSVDKINQLSSLLKSIKHCLNTKEILIKSLRDEICNLKEKISTIEKTPDLTGNLKRALSDSDKIKKKKDQELEMEYAKIKQLKEEIDKLKNELARSNQTIFELRADVKHVTNDLGVANGKIKEFSKNRYDPTEMDNLTKKIDKLQKIITGLENQVENYQRENKEKSEEESKLREKIENLESKLKNGDKFTKEKQVQLEDFKKKVVGNQEKVERLNNQKTYLEDKILKETCEKEDLLNKFNQLNSKIVDLEKKNNCLNNRVTNLITQNDRKKLELQKSINEANQAKLDISTIQRELCYQKDLNASIKCEIGKLRRIINEKECQIRQTDRNYEQLKQKYTDLCNQNSVNTFRSYKKNGLMEENNNIFLKSNFRTKKDNCL